MRRKVAPSDLVQETMADAVRDFADFEGENEAQFLAWMRQILLYNLPDGVGQIVEQDLPHPGQELGLVFSFEISEVSNRVRHRLLDQVGRSHFAAHLIAKISIGNQ